MFIVIVILLLSCLFYVYSLSKEWVIKQHFLNMGFQILIFMSLFLCSNTPKARKHRCNSRASVPALDEHQRGVRCVIPLTMHPCSVVFFPPVFGFVPIQNGPPPCRRPPFFCFMWSCERRKKKRGGRRDKDGTMDRKLWIDF